MTSTPDPSETVRLHVIIDIQVDEVADTGIPLAEWNAMTPAARQVEADRVWQAASEIDGGGVQVVTPGAETI